MKYHTLGSIDKIPYSDLCTLDLVDDLLEILDQKDYEAYRFQYGPTPYGSPICFEDLAAIDYQKKIIVWICEDSFITHIEFDWYNESRPSALVGLEKICNQHPNKNFILLTDCKNLARYLSVPNLHVVELSDINWSMPYSKLSSCGYQSKTSMKYSWICFLNHETWHRVALLSFLLAKNLDRYGTFTVGKKNFLQRCRQFEHIQQFLTYDAGSSTYEFFDQGYQRIIKGDFHALDLPPLPPNLDNLSNYRENLLPVYNQTRLEICTSSLFSEEYLSMSEKELQALHACNFVIFIGSAGTVNWIRKQGFDVFDDVVNHDYDNIVEPHRRLITAIETNEHLLNGSVDLDGIWQSRKQRFAENCSLIHNIKKLLDDQARNMFAKVIKTIHGK